MRAFDRIDHLHILDERLPLIGMSGRSESPDDVPHSGRKGRHAGLESGRDTSTPTMVSPDAVAAAVSAQGYPTRGARNASR